MKNFHHTIKRQRCETQQTKFDTAVQLNPTRTMAETHSMIVKRPRLSMSPNRASTAQPTGTRRQTNILPPGPSHSQQASGIFMKRSRRESSQMLQLDIRDKCIVEAVDRHAVENSFQLNPQVGFWYVDLSFLTVNS